MKKTNARPHKPARIGKWIYSMTPMRKMFYPVRHAEKTVLRTEERTVNGLPEELDGLKIGFVSDIHFGSFLGPEKVKEVFSAMAELQPDLLLLGGDYGEDAATAVRFFEHAAGMLHAKLGVFAVPGNHDGAEAEDPGRLTGSAEKAGARMLLNESVRITRGGRVLAVCGTDEYYSGKADPDSMEEDARKADLSILLTHTPDVLPEYFARHERSAFTLIFCGHTHGGQVALFGRALHPSSLYGNRYNSGWKEENGSGILISTGVGTSLLPVRFGTRSEYHLITLRSRK